ncbi:hypothetical protein Sliba_68470 [Streptomyces nigrescens]|uniref:Uncharacterized protein n=1 Tax=Streptomyces nigrescens TaxID=1920 RepID=A0A640TT33_STRNI|nr:hypothetical protein Sliba_68470 [Streptomyces libani subsp. libani]GGW07714.1 hypothetical protein GCM10010500_77020 [Streptomyces libani subsp. libani]
MGYQPVAVLEDVAVDGVAVSECAGAAWAVAAVAVAPVSMAAPTATPVSQIRVRMIPLAVEVPVCCGACLLACLRTSVIGHRVDDTETLSGLLGAGPQRTARRLAVLGSAARALEGHAPRGPVAHQLQTYRCHLPLGAFTHFHSWAEFSPSAWQDDLLM